MNKIIMILKNHLGEIKSSPINVSDEELENIITLSKSFYLNDQGIEMWTEDGFVVVSAEITKHSMLFINIIKDEEV